MKEAAAHTPTLSLLLFLFTCVPPSFYPILERARLRGTAFKLICLVDESYTFDRSLIPPPGSPLSKFHHSSPSVNPTRLLRFPSIHILTPIPFLILSKTPLNSSSTSQPPFVSILLCLPENCCLFSLKVKKVCKL